MRPNATREARSLTDISAKSHSTTAPQDEFASQSIFSLAWREIPATPIADPTLFAALKRHEADVVLVRTTTSGSAPIRYTSYISRDDHSLPYARNFAAKTSHRWDAAYIAIIDRPALLDVWYGSLFLPTSEGVKIIEETLYISGERRKSYFRDLNCSEEFSFCTAEIPHFDPEEDIIYLPLLNIQSAVYFHMMSEALLQAFVFASAVCSDRIRGIVPQTRRPIADLAVREAGHLGIASIAASRRFVWLPRTGLYSCFHQHARMNPDFRRLADYLRRAYGGRPLPSEIGIWKAAKQPGRRLYVTRANAAARPLANEAELVDLVVTHGFEVVDPGKLPFAEQIALFASASIVMGPHGAGLTNAAFCDGDATLIELRALNRASQSPSRNETYRRLSACCGLQYGYLMFDNPAFSEGWEVDLEPVRRVLRRIDEQGVSRAHRARD